MSVNGEYLKSKKAAQQWAALFHRACALPEVVDTNEAIIVADLAFNEMGPIELAIEDEQGTEENHHFVNVCSCGEVISQCRCMSKDKKKTIIQDGCEKCKKKAEAKLSQEIDKVHKFASTQFNLEDAAWSRDEDPLPKIRHMSRQILDEDLADDGREEYPHITVKYGLHTGDADEVAQVVRDFGPVQVTLGKTFIFPGEEYDVVNVEVKSPALVRLNKLISDSLECTDTHPNYVPHVCLAYVKSGLGEKYEGIDRVNGMRLTFQDLIFSDKRRELVDCRLSLEPINANFAYDIENRRAQGILNRTVELSKKFTASAKKDLATVLKTADPYELSQGLLRFIAKYRVQLADLLTTTQLASLLEGAREVAKSIPIVPMFSGAMPPATLEPAKAVELIDKLKAMPLGEREEAIYKLPADQQQFARQGILALQQGGEPPVTTFTPAAPVSGIPEKIHYPIIDEAARELSTKNVMTRPQFDALDSAARQKAFTVAYVESLDTMEKIRDVMAETIKDGVDVQTFRERVLEAVDEGTFMSDAHLENVYRTNIQTAFSDGQMAVLSHPFVQSGFPYASYEAIDDDRVEHTHLALMKLGIQNTNIYRIDDPVFQLFRPPWRWCCRCSWIPMTVKQAAREGIDEAKQWLETGVEPADKAFVAMPDFRPPPGFVRSVTGMPLSIEDEQGNLHSEKTGRFVSVYHGSENEFSGFNKKAMGANTAGTPLGFYFSESKDVSEKFGSYIKRVNVHVKKPFDFEEKANKKIVSEVSDAVKALDGKQGVPRFPHMAFVEQLDQIRQTEDNKDGAVSLFGVWKALSRSVGGDRNAIAVLHKLGYDTLTYNATGAWGDYDYVPTKIGNHKKNYGRTWIAFHQNQINDDYAPGKEVLTANQAKLSLSVHFAYDIENRPFDEWLRTQPLSIQMSAQPIQEFGYEWKEAKVEIVPLPVPPVVETPKKIGGNSHDRRKARRARESEEKAKADVALSVAADARMEKLIEKIAERDERPINVVVNVPEQQSVVIPAPVVNVNPEITVNVPERKPKTVQFEHDSQGNVTKATEVEG